MKHQIEFIDFNSNNSFELSDENTTHQFSKKINSSKHSKNIPLYFMSVSAGIGEPVETYINKEIDLNEYLIEHPLSTFFTRVIGDDMREAGICNGDILIVDKSIIPTDGKIVIAKINGTFLIKYYRFHNGISYLESHSQSFFPVDLGDDFKYEILGVVTKIIHTFK